MFYYDNEGRWIRYLVGGKHDRLLYYRLLHVLRQHYFEVELQGLPENRVWVNQA